MQKRITSFILLFSIILSSIFTCVACSQSQKNVAEHFEYFDTYCSLTVYSDEQSFSLLATEFNELLQSYHELFDIYNLYDGIINLKALNDSAALSNVQVSTELFDALIYSKELYSLTKGKFNVAIGALSSLWHDARIYSATNPENAYIPSQGEITEALFHIDINDLILDKENQTVFFSDSKLSLDFGAIAKGYVSSIIYNRLIELNCDSFLINLGGNVIAYGEKPKNEFWSIKIENPFNEASKGYNDVIKLYDSTIVTSGSYQRYFTYNDKQYSHIIDSESGYPADIFSSISIQAPADYSALADALSTALFCMTYEDGLSLIERLEGVEALWIFKDGSYKATPSFGGAK